MAQSQWVVTSYLLVNTTRVGQMLLAIPLITAVVAPMSGWLYDRLQSTYHSSLGMLIMAAGKAKKHSK
jgi:Na+/melibiose symporter-like transporter